MDDIISRRAAIKAIDDLPNCYNGYSDTYDKSCIIGVLEELPPADHSKAYAAGYEQGRFDERIERWLTAEKKGKWIVHKSPDEYHCGMVECPFCREELIAEPNEYCFCPKCGARMEQ